MKKLQMIFKKTRTISYPMYIFIPVSIALIWILSSPIHMFMTISDWRLKMNGVDSVEIGGLEYYNQNLCQKDKECECVLLIHGLGDTLYTWSKTMTSERKDWQKPLNFYAINLPGSGKSKALEKNEDYRINLLANRILNNLPPASCKKWHLVGNSLGGWIASKMAVQAPEKIKSLGLLNAAGLDRDYSHIVDIFLDPTKERLKSFHKKAYANPKPLPSYIFSDLAKRLKGLPVVSIMRAQTKEDFIDQDFASIDLPIFMLWGEKDQVIPLDFAIEMQKINSNVSLEVIENCAHIPQKECFDAFKNFLNQQVTGT